MPFNNCITQHMKDQYTDMHDIHYITSAWPRPGLYVQMRVGDWYYRGRLVDCSVEEAEQLIPYLEEGLVRASIQMGVDRYVNNYKALLDQFMKERVKELQEECDRLQLEIAQRRSNLTVCFPKPIFESWR